LPADLVQFAPFFTNMSETQLVEIDGVPVYQDDTGRVYWESGADIDADGANGQNGNPFAYRLDNKGLDYLSDAGWPDGGWQNVLIDDGSGHPLTDGDGNCYSSTTYVWPDRPVQTRYVDATAVPYIVVNPIVRMETTGVVIGCKAKVTYNGKSVDAVVVDVGPRDKIGEISIAAAQALGIPDSAKYGGVNSGVQYEMWPGQAATVNGETYVLEPA